MLITNTERVRINANRIKLSLIICLIGAIKMYDKTTIGITGTMTLLVYSIIEKVIIVLMMNMPTG